MTISRPDATISIDGQDLSLAESATATLFVVSTSTLAHDRATLTLGPGSPVLAVAPGARVEVSLGTSDLDAVFTGAVARVAHQPWGTEVHALSASAALDAVRVGRAFRDQSIGDIVSNLLAEGGVNAGAIEGGPTLPVFYADEGRSAWRHLCRLAGLVLAELTSDASGAVNFRPPRSGTADHTLRAGAELLSWAVGRRNELAAVPSVGPFSAASEQGADAWSLLHHDPGGSGAHHVHPLLRDRDIAQVVDDATAVARSRAGDEGWATVMGDAAIRAGDLVELESIERAAATYRVVTSRHEIGIDGFVTTMRLEGAS